MPMQDEWRNPAPVDRAARDALAAKIRQWLHEEITGEELRQALTELQSDDPTLPLVIAEMKDWLDLCSGMLAYTNCRRVLWEPAQGVLLVLASQWQIEEYFVSWLRTGIRLLAAALLLCLLAGWVAFGASFEFAAVWYASGLIGAVLAVWEISRDSEPAVCFPFASEEEMQQVARTVPQFQPEPRPRGFPEPAVPESPSFGSRVDDVMHRASVCLLAAPFTLPLLLFASWMYDGMTHRVVPELPA